MLTLINILEAVAPENVLNGMFVAVEVIDLASERACEVDGNRSGGEL